MRNVTNSSLRLDGSEFYCRELTAAVCALCIRSSNISGEALSDSELREVR